MKLWLVCFLILFLGAETAQWLGQLPWVSSVALSLPLTVVGGIGLAIASNYATLFGRPWPSLGASAARPDLLPPPEAPPVEAPIVDPQTTRKGDSISFEIRKPRGKREDEGMRG